MTDHSGPPGGAMRRAFKDVEGRCALTRTGAHARTRTHTHTLVHHLLSTTTTKRWREMQPTDGSPPKCHPEKTAHVRKTKFQFNKILTSFLPPKRKFPWRFLGRWQSKMSYLFRTTTPSRMVSTKGKNAFGFRKGVAVTDGA